MPTIHRRQFIGTAAAIAGLTALSRNFTRAETAATRQVHDSSEPAWTHPPHPQPGRPGIDYQPSVTLNGSTLPFKIVDGVKVMHLTCEEVWHEFIPKSENNQALRATCWGFNKQVHGPTIECVEGDRLRIYVTNNLPAATSIHWHGIILPSGMDGVGGLSQKTIQPGETFKYEYTVWQHGTFMYHSHHDEMTQMALGMLGMFIIHPRDPDLEKFPRPDRDFVMMLSEWRIDPGTTRPNPNEMKDFNLLTINAKAFPGTAPLIVKKGDHVKIRIGNLSAMDHHPFHFHGHKWLVTETDGGRIATEGQWPETTILVPTGSTRTVEFLANNPGDWAMHCHMTHHVMNQMGHDIPNSIGIVPADFDKRARKVVPGYMTMGQDGMGDMGDMGMSVPRNSTPMVGAVGPHGYITMGGMYTNLKVRENLTDYETDPGWYVIPPGLGAVAATADELRRDGITAS